MTAAAGRADAAVGVDDAREQVIGVLTGALDEAREELAALARFGGRDLATSTSRAAAQLAVDELLERGDLVRDLAGLARPRVPVTTATYVVVPREVLARWARELAGLGRVADWAVGLVIRRVAGRIAVYALRREES